MDFGVYGTRKTEGYFAKEGRWSGVDIGKKKSYTAVQRGLSHNDILRIEIKPRTQRGLRAHA